MANLKRGKIFYNFGGGIKISFAAPRVRLKGYLLKTEYKHITMFQEILKFLVTAQLY